MATPTTATTPPVARRKRRIFLWVFLAIQVLFLILVIAGAASGTGSNTTQVASACFHGAWSPLFASQADCVKHYGVALNDAANTGKGIGVFVVVVVWIVVDFLLGLVYGIYRLARRT